MNDVLAIVGSRFIPEEGKAEARTIIRDVFERQRPDLVISGGATGVDTLAREMAGEAGLEIIEYLPRNARWEPQGYKARNVEIAQACSRLLCIRWNWSLTYGSGWTADRAEELGKTVWRVWLPLA